MKENNNHIDFEKLDERIERFLRDEMNEQEIEEFRAELKSNSVLAERAEALAVLIKSIKEVGQKKDEQIKASVLHPKQSEENTRKLKESATNVKFQPQQKVNRSYKLYLKIVAVAASFLLIVGVTDFFMVRQRTLDLAWSSMQLAPQFDSAEGAFKGGEDDSVLVADLQSTFDDIRQDVRLEHSIKHLAELFDRACSEIVNPYTDYADYIGYNLAVAYLKDNDRVEARKVLVRLIALYPNYQDAKELLIKIDQLKGLW